MKVWVLQYHDGRLYGVYSTRDAAISALEKHWHAPYLSLGELALAITIVNVDEGA